MENLLIDKVRAFIRQHRLFTSGETVVVGVSGGADSVCLLRMLAMLEELQLRLVAVHLNHSLRGREADADEDFVRDLAAELGIPFESARCDVKELAAGAGLSLEEAGREARYRFFAEVAERHGATKTALAHHAGDQAETVLMRLIRGAGSDGLAAMRSLTDDGRVRPFLAVSREEIESWLTERGFSWREDASNADTAFLRNRIRHELLPLLQTYNPAAVERLRRSAEILAEESALLDRLAQKRADRLLTPVHGGIALDLASFAEEPRALRLRLLREAFRRSAGSLAHLDFDHLERVDALALSRKTTGELHLPGGVRVVKWYTRLVFFLKTLRSSPWELDIPGCGEYLLPSGALFTVTEAPIPSNPADFPPDSTCFDADLVPFPWQVRSFAAGDRFVPLGTAGTRKVKRVLIDTKIPAELRGDIPLLTDGKGTIIWICGVRRSAHALVTPSTSKMVTAKLQHGVNVL